jgi:hypothetical protein
MASKCMPIKWEFNTKYNFTDKKFNSIFDFFVIKCPVENVSERGITFKDRNIDLKKLNSKIKKINNNFAKNWEVMETGKVDVQLFLEEKQLFKSVDKPYEFAYHTKTEKRYKTESLFYSIRCALAHGSFATHKYNGEKYYFFENKYKSKNKDKDKDKLKARICLKETTLLKIIDIVGEESKIKNKALV